MKIVKHYWFIAIALITMISFSSCENDEERGFDISGLYGKTWWGEMGFEDPTHTENGFTVILHSPQVLSRIMV